ncbi:MAG: phage major capsid protein [Ruminococcus sp.]|nr:phage major capsid protein [Ruminococcus sp.]
MYNDIKLEKGLYNLSEKSFTDALEELDPSASYCGTPMEKLDAFERQLKRFNIRIAGSNCDRIEKFFSSTETAVLFPEFVTRCIRKGFDETVLSSVCAAQTVSGSSQYLGCVMDDSAEYKASTEASVLPTTTVKESSSATILSKYGRLINASYEAIRQQRLDVFGVMLRSIGVKLAVSVVKKAVSVLEAGADVINADSLTYSALAELYGSFDCFNMNTIIASPQDASKIVAMEQLSDTSTDANGKMILPFGSELIKTSAVSSDTIIGIDRNFALEFITSSNLVMETDKLIDRQLDQITVSITCGFRKITAGAVKVLKIEE